MTREELEHIIRAAADVTGADAFIILGSQAILGAAPSAPLLAAGLAVSTEADIYVLDSPELTDLIEGAMGRERLAETELDAPSRERIEQWLSGIAGS